MPPSTNGCAQTHACSATQRRLLEKTVSGKRFTRYYQDNRFRAAIDEQFAKADAIVQDGIWIIYAIHDPSKADEIGNEEDGPIIYVGLTKRFSKRIRQRMTAAGTATTRPQDYVEGMCYDLMRRGHVPRFSIRAYEASALDGLVTETNTANAALAAGYRVLNRLAEQKSGGPAITRSQVPHTWLWPLSVSDAIGSRIELIVIDPESKRQTTADLRSFPSKIRLAEIRFALKRRNLSSRLYVSES
jgi:hypothetical protein